MLAAMSPMVDAEGASNMPAAKPRSLLSQTGSHGIHDS